MLSHLVEKALANTIYEINISELLLQLLGWALVAGLSYLQPATVQLSQKLSHPTSDTCCPDQTPNVLNVLTSPQNALPQRRTTQSNNQI